MDVISHFYIADFEFSLRDYHGHQPDTVLSSPNEGPVVSVAFVQFGFFFFESVKSFELIN